jgi:hypothetical protein
MNIESSQMWKKVGFHIAWYAFFCPVLGSCFFLWISMISETEHGLWVSAICSLLISVLGVIWCCIYLLPIAAITLLGVGFLPRYPAILFNILAVFVAPWTIIWESRSFFLDDPVLIVIESSVLAFITVVLYDRLGLHSMFLALRR